MSEAVVNQWGFYDPDRIPCAVVAPVLEYAFSQWVFWKENRTTDDFSHYEQSSGKYVTCQRISERYGGSPDTWLKRLNKIVKQDFETCSLNVVDHFLVALEQQHLWYVPPLSDYYFSEQVLNAA